MHIFNLIQDGSAKYIKHRTYVDNYSSVLPLMKNSFTGKFNEFDFSQNLSLRPTYDVQSAHFSGKQFTLQFAIIEPFDTCYHYHLSNDTKHDPFCVDQVLRISPSNMISKTRICGSKAIMHQSSIKISMRLLYYKSQLMTLILESSEPTVQLAHGKGVIDIMSSFGVKNILRKDIVTHDVFFNNSAEIADYLSSINPHYYYKTVLVEDLMKTWRSFTY